MIYCVCVCVCAVCTSLGELRKVRSTYKGSFVRNIVLEYSLSSLRLFYVLIVRFESTTNPASIFASLLFCPLLSRSTIFRLVWSRLVSISNYIVTCHWNWIRKVKRKKRCVRRLWQVTKKMKETERDYRKEKGISWQITLLSSVACGRTLILR